MKIVSEWHSPHIAVVESEIHGRGIFANSLVSSGDTIIKMGGIIIYKSDFDINMHCKYSTISISEECFLTRLLDSPKTMDDYINHSCRPNSWLLDEFTIVAKEPIGIGNEITIDYAVWLDQSNYKPLGPCSCGADICRHWITGKDWNRIDVINDNYGHFTPHINTKIDLAISSMSGIVK